MSPVKLGLLKYGVLAVVAVAGCAGERPTFAIGTGHHSDDASGGDAMPEQTVSDETSRSSDAGASNMSDATSDETSTDTSEATDTSEHASTDASEQSSTDSTTGSTSSSETSSESGICGDGVFGVGEACDDGNTQNEDACPYGQATCVACNATCSEPITLTGPTCGDGTVSNGESCDNSEAWCKDCKIVSRIAAGGYSTCALLADGSAKCWGDGNNGKLGNGAFEDQATPVLLTALGDQVTGITMGNEHACAMLRDGSARCWGDGIHGQLGEGDSEDRGTPVDVLNLGGQATSIAAGGGHSCASLSDGAVTCWGNGYWGQLGNAGTDGQGNPVAVIDLGGTATAVATGASHTCALLDNGIVKCWGAGSSGKLGNGSTEPSPTPVSVLGIDDAVAIAAGFLHTCALLSSGSVKCWGSSRDGQLGNGDTEDHAIPVEVVSLGQRATAIATGESHSCAVLDDGTVKCWGLGGSYQLGNVAADDQSTPVTVSGLGARAVGIALGWYHSCALLVDDSVQCWGEGEQGQLGDGQRVTNSRPVSVVGIP